MNKQREGIKPQDVLVLSKIIAIQNEVFKQLDLALELGISQAEIAHSLNRLKRAGLLNENKKKLNKLAVIEFFKHVLKFLFPVELEGSARGISIGPSADFIKRKVRNDDFGIVVEDIDGKDKGVAVVPIYKTVAKAIKNDEKLYKIICLVDIFRGLGSVRHRQVAEAEFNKIILGK